MSRGMTPEFAAALADRNVGPVIFYEGEFNSGVLRLWSGLGDFEWNGVTWTGAGNLLGFGSIQEGDKIEAYGTSIKLSGIPLDLVQLCIQEARQGLPGKVWVGLMTDDAAEWTPLEVFRQGETGSWPNLLDPANVFTTQTPTVNTPYGGRIGYVTDVTGNGNPIVNPTEAQRPLYGQAPAEVRNRLDQTEDFSTANNLLLDNLPGSTPAPQGGGFMRLLRPTATSSTHRLRYASNTPGAYTVTIFAKAAGYRYLVLLRSAGSRNAVFDLQTGTVVVSPIVAIAPVTTDDMSATMDHVGDGVYRCRYTQGSANVIDIGVNQSLTDGSLETFAGDGVSGIEMWGIQEEVGTEPTRYQRVNSRLDITEALLPSYPYARLDLVDDRLPIPFADGFSGDVAVFGRNGSWIQRDVVITPGGVLDIGSNTIPGAPAGLIAALGDIVGVVPVGRTITDAEAARMSAYFKTRGAKGYLVLGPELIGDPDFDEPAYWSTVGNVVVTGGEAVFTAAGTNNLVQRLIPEIVNGTFYLGEITIEAISAGSLRFAANGGSNISYSPSYNSAGKYSHIVPSTGSSNIPCVRALGTTSGAVSRFSLRALIPEEVPDGTVPTTKGRREVIADPILANSGRLDVPNLEDSADTCSITITYEGRLIGLLQAREWRYTDESQQVLYSGDRGFEYVTTIQDKDIQWGTK